MLKETLNFSKKFIKPKGLSFFKPVKALRRKWPAHLSTPGSAEVSHVPLRTKCPQTPFTHSNRCYCPFKHSTARVCRPSNFYHKMLRITAFFPEGQPKTALCSFLHTTYSTGPNLKSSQLLSNSLILLLTLQLTPTNPQQLQEGSLGGTRQIMLCEQNLTFRKI